jgi:lysophospholipase L1-like esterase
MLLLLGRGAVLASPLGGGSQARHSVLVIIGDSMSTGYGLDDPLTQSWPAILVQKHPRAGQLVNLAVPGYEYAYETPCTNSLCSGARTQTQMAISAHPTLIIIWMGINDFVAGRSVGAVTHDLDHMLGLLAMTHARIFVINYPDMSALGEPPGGPINHADLAFNRAMLPILARDHAALIDMYQATHAIWGNPSDIQQNNAAHPTAKGSVAIAQVVYAALHRDGAL